MAATSPLSLKAQRARDAVLEWIDSGRLRPGQKMPSERELAARLGMNHQTVRRGLEALARDGVIIKEPRVGSFVQPRAAGLPGEPSGDGIGLILPRYLFDVRSHAAAASFLGGASQIFEPRRFHLQTLVYRKHQLWEDAGHIAVTRRLRGVVLTPTVQSSPDVLQRMLDGGVKVVLINAPPTFRGLAAPWVNEDFVTPARHILGRLLALGHRRLLVLHYEASEHRDEQLEAIRQTCQSHGLTGVSRMLLSIDNLETLDLEALLNNLAQRFDELSPTAVVAPDEITANTVMGFLYSRHLRVPADVSVAAMTNFAPLLSPVPLTSPDSVQLRQQVIATAAERLQRLMDDQPPAEHGTVLTPELCWRRSIAPAAPARPVKAPADPVNSMCPVDPEASVA